MCLIRSLTEKSNFDPFLQTSVLGLDTLGGFAMLAAAMTVCSPHRLGGMHRGGSPGQSGNCQTHAALVSFGQNLPPLGIGWFGLKSCLP